MIRLVVTGDREWDDADRVRDAFIRVDAFASGRGVRLAHGACRGLDMIADRIARELGWEVRDYPCEFETGPGDGPRRNERMLEVERPDLVLAFHDDFASSRGTRACVLAAKRMNLPVKVLTTRPRAVVLRTRSPDGLVRRATFSSCRTYRYSLERTWGDEPKLGPRFVYVMLNPSTADHEDDDPTVSRVMTRCRNEAPRGTLEVLNAFALRSTDPKALKGHEDPVGSLNDGYLKRGARTAYRLVVAWGTHGSLLGRGCEVERLLRAEGRVKLECLGTTKAGHPRHPLYLSFREGPRPWPGYGGG